MFKYFFFLIILFVACKAQQTVIATEDPIEEEILIAEPEMTEERLLEEIAVTAPRGYVLPPYNPSATQEWDLIHTNLELRFDWTNEHVIGRATITAKPYFYPQQYLMLDAKGMNILSLTDGNDKDLEYEYNGKKLDIDMTQLYTNQQEVEIIIDYIAKPSEGPISGSAAITSDKGLFFINPRNEEANKPQQIWTQGETEHNSKWFPTIDKPNERMTQAISLTVDDRFKTLSNGTLVRSVKDAAGQRTDYWEQKQPHAPYLAMIAVGEFAVVKEKWNDIELEYYVEPKYEAYAKDIFAHTPEMMEYFSTILNYPYPWDKYSQIITRDYVSGAMENTTAVIFGDFIQKTDRELIDNDNDFIVAHEMFHHWFGDLVTCESWANLTLQEGFANYSEHLWQEHKYGMDAAGYQRSQELQGYLGSIVQSGTHELIYYGYGDKEEMFDGHSYNKGGLVLHMLRAQIGDDAFFQGLNKYLTDHKYTAVEVDELRMAFEDVTGIDLNWFFDQWYHEAGHPELKLEYGYDETAQEIIVNVTQEQDPENSPPIFQLPVTIAAYDADGKASFFDVTLNKREQKLRLVYDRNPALVVFDQHDKLLYTKQEEKSIPEYINQYNWVGTYIHRKEAIEAIKNKREANATLEKALDDPHFSIRKVAVEKVRTKDRPDLAAKIQKMVTEDPHSAVRAEAISKLKKINAPNLTATIESIFAKEQAYPVLGRALNILSQLDEEAAVKQANLLKSEQSSQLASAIGDVLARTGDPVHLPYFENQLTNISLYSVFGFYDNYRRLVAEQSVAEQIQSAEKLKSIATDPGQNMFYKYSATNAIYGLIEGLPMDQQEAKASLGSMIQTIKSLETDELLLQRYSSY